MGKFRPAYKVTIDGKTVGYVLNKVNFENLVNDEILNPDVENVAFVDIETMPSYNLLLLNNTTQTNEEEIFTKLQEMAVTTYRMYAITLNNENTTFVNSRDEAEEIIAKMKEEVGDSKDIEIGMQELYTQNVEETKQTVELAVATQTAEIQLSKEIAELKRIASQTFEGVYFSVKPVKGNITSRFGAIESIRNHVHKGMDIAAANGTPIKVAANGTVTFSGWMSGYGNLIIVSHSNGIQTYYGHCSKLYVSVGKEVKAGDVIAAVGSTGDSTGNHLHFEIRKNGVQVNPALYVYK